MADGLKDRDLQDYYESLAAMFESKGWKYLAEDMVKLHDAANTLDGIESESELHLRRGQVDILKKMLAQPVVTAAAYEILLDDEK